MLGDDIEKNRIEHVARIEADNTLLREQLAQVKSLARRWTLRHNVVVNLQEGMLELSVRVADKSKTIRLAAESVLGMHDDVNTLIAVFAEQTAQEMYVDLIKEEISEQLLSGVKNLKTINQRSSL